MKEFIQHPVYGDIVYNESIWTGKKTMTINGVDAQPVSKKEFTSEGKKVVITGNILMGLKLQIDNDIVEVSPRPTWYEIVLAVIPLIFLLTWGNSVALCSIFPVVGGAIGGALGSIGLITSLLLMKNAKSSLTKLIIGIGTFVGTVLIAFVLALLIITFIGQRQRVVSKLQFIADKKTVIWLSFLLLSAKRYLNELRRRLFFVILSRGYTPRRLLHFCEGSPHRSLFSFMVGRGTPLRKLELAIGSEKEILRSVILVLE